MQTAVETDAIAPPDFPLVWRPCRCTLTGPTQPDCPTCQGRGQVAERAPRLSIELVPKTCWWKNVRGNVSKADWDKCKAMVRARSGDRCEVCGGRGQRWPVDCHEVWHYGVREFDGAHVQTLVDLAALCPACHQVKHLGRSMAVRDGDRAIAHLAAVNRWPADLTYRYAAYAFDLWRARSQHEWQLDVSLLSALGINPKRSAGGGGPGRREQNVQPGGVALHLLQ